MKLFGFSISLFVMLTTSQAEAKLHIDIYIESLCRFSQQFMSDQFRPAYDESIKHDIDVNFFPFGKSKSFLNDEGEVEFKCQHGPAECKRNKFQSCGLYQIGDNQDLQVEFIICTMNATSTYLQCADALALNRMDIEACVAGPLGNELQLKMENASAAIISETNHVPTITYNREYDSTDFFASMASFKEVVMGKLSKQQ